MNDNQMIGDSNFDVERHKCLNCGTVLHEGNYCHICGQPSTTTRLTTKNLTVTILSGLTRINGRFLHTYRMLLLRPWQLISEYINGRRAVYVAPVQLLIILVFIYLALQSFFGGEDHGVKATYSNFQFLAGDSAFVVGINYVVRFFITSMTLIYILLLIPYMPVVKLYHRMLGIKKFNAAEYIVAALYLSCFIVAVSVLMIIPRIVLGYYVGESSMLLLGIMTAAIFSVFSVALYKSFGSSHKSKAMKMSLTAINIFLCMLIYTVMLVAFIGIHRISFGQW